MIEAQSSLIVLFVILLLGLIIPSLLRKFHIPFISLIILSGAIAGPYGLGYIQSNVIIEFFGFLGITFLMLIAGLETNVSLIKKNKVNITKMALLNGGLPFLTGFLITYLFGYPFFASIIVGIIFISSSIAVIVPSLKNAHIFNKKSGQMIIAAVLLTDIISLVVLGIFFQFFNSLQLIPSILYLILILILIIGVYLIFPFITKLGIKLGFSDEDAYEGRIRFILVLAIGLLIVFSFLKVHPILAAFLAGIILSENIKDLKKRDVYHKIHVLGYGLFIPIFFFIVGMELNLSLFLDFNLKNMVIIFLIPGLIISKVVSGYLSGKLVGLKNKESFIYGAISMTHLTTALAATYAASSLGILDNVLVSSIILISIITVILGPASVDYISRKTEQEKL